jgi:hypothetical protein
MPQFERYENPLPYTAEGVITQFMVVTKGTAHNQAIAPSGADVGGILGVARHAAADGEFLTVDGPGSYVRCIASAAITAGASVAIAGTTGKVKSVTTADTNIVGVAQTDAADDGDQIFVYVNPVNNT